MSVAKGEQGRCKSHIMMTLKALHEHTMQVTDGKKFSDKPAYRELVSSICRTSERMFIDAFTANNIYVKSTQTYEKRIDCSTNAILGCNSLLALIELAYRIYHLRGKQVVFWANMVIEARDELSAWRKSDKDRYKGYSKP